MAFSRLTITALLVGCVLACSGSGATYVVDQADRDMLFTIDDIPGEHPEGTSAIEKTRDFDGAWNFVYSYESSDLTLSTTVFIENDADSAGWVMMGTGLLDSSLAADGVEYVESASLCSIGHEQSCGHLTSEGVHGGAICRVRDNNVVVIIILAGQPLSDEKGCDPLLQDVIQQANSYTPSATPTP